MKNTTRKGLTITINEKLFVNQVKLLYGGKVYYKATRKDGVVFEFLEPIIGLPVTEPIIQRESLPTPTVTESTSSRLLRAEDCPSAGGGFVVTKAAVDEFESEKYKGEVFFTHKTSPGLIIKKQGIVIHDTKMEDMYKRR